VSLTAAGRDSLLQGIPLLLHTPCVRVCWFLTPFLTIPRVIRRRHELNRQPPTGLSKHLPLFLFRQMLFSRSLLAAILRNENPVRRQPVADHLPKPSATEAPTTSRERRGFVAIREQVPSGTAFPPLSAQWPLRASLTIRQLTFLFRVCVRCFITPCSIETLVTASLQLPSRARPPREWPRPHACECAFVASRVLLVCFVGEGDLTLSKPANDAALAVIHDRHPPFQKETTPTIAPLSRESVSPPS